MAQENIRRRAFGAILGSALLSWQSLITIAITAVLFLFVPAPFTWWQPWFWLVAGAIAEAAFVISSLSDPQAAEQAVAREFAGRYDLDRIKSPVSRQRLRDAIEYRKNMAKLADRHGGSMRASLKTTVADVDDWIGQMYELALHIDAFESNELVERDRRAVPQQLEKARQRLKIERDEAVQRDLSEQVRQLELQLANLEATASSVKRAEIQLESTLSSLGTIYAQMSLLGTKEVDSSRAQRLRDDVREEVNQLQDTIHALDEVQSQRLQLR
jgi:predicted  nucleic acid-binding Zn-ribbon protein